MVILESRNIDPGKDSAFLCLFAVQSTTLGFFLFFLSSPFLLCLCKMLASASLSKKH